MRWYHYVAHFFGGSLASSIEADVIHRDASEPDERAESPRLTAGCANVDE
jgi:hypothetical protein